MQNKSSKRHHFTMNNLNARVGVTVCFQDITERQINMAKLYSHGEMTMFKSYVPNSMHVTYTIQQYEMCILRYVRLLTCH